MNSNDIKETSERWWISEEERYFLKVYHENWKISEKLVELGYYKDAFILFMVSVECFFKYTYALSRHDSLSRISLYKKILHFLGVTMPQPKPAKNFGHSVRLILSQMRHRHKNLGCREIQEFILRLPPDSSLSFTEVSKMTWMDLRYRDGEDSEVKEQCKKYLDDLKPRFIEIRRKFFGGVS